VSVKYGDDYEYANAKLSDSIVSFNGHPVYVERVDEEGDVRYTPLGSNDRPLTARLKDFDLTPLPLGNINLNRGMVSYAARYPVRGWKQGLRMGSIYFLTNSTEGRRINPHDTGFVNCLTGNYPTMKSCIESLVCEEAQQIAFSREFFLHPFDKTGMSLLGYKNIIVGVGRLTEAKDNLLFTLNEKYKFLQETLEGVLHAKRNG
jgi:hypothetical protein